MTEKKKSSDKISRAYMEEPIRPERTKPRIKQRQGRCYELAFKCLMESADVSSATKWTLVHGICLCGPNRTKEWHAVLISGDVVYCPVFDRSICKTDYFKQFEFEPIAAYSIKEAAVLAVETGHYGPWIDIAQEK